MEGLWGWRPASERRVWSDCVVVLAPLLDDDLRFFQNAEDFTVEKLVA